MSLRRHFFSLFVLGWCLLACVSALAQTEAATLSGLITDPQGRPVSGVQVTVTNQDTNVSIQRTTNDAGLYVAAGMKPGRYRVTIAKDGFRRVDLTDLVLNVQDVLSRNFQLQLGPVTTSITVVADEAKVDTTDATVSTVVDRQFAENLPMNGRSFQTLIQLTPGVVLAGTNQFDSGQFNINGQRAAANYWTVDGVSANFGMSAFQNLGNGLGGAATALNAIGGTNSLVSVDALQEFRIQTSTYAPEFGRTPGGQISIVTRSGTNNFHGNAFDYLRNDALDASNWFNGFSNNPPLAKAKERQNDFGGTFSGPILKDKTFFFFSYEGLRLRLPQTTLTTVPDLSARQSAAPATLPFLNAYPLPNGIDNTTTGVAQFNATYSNPASVDAYSLRVDHKLNDKLSLFARYDYSPSNVLSRGSGVLALSTVLPIDVNTQTATAGATWNIRPTVVNDFRFNYSRTSANSRSAVDNFGGAIPFTVVPFPDPSFTVQNSVFNFQILGLQGRVIEVGTEAHNFQRQINTVDSVSVQRGNHSLKFGIDFRRLSPSYDFGRYGQANLFLGVQSAVGGNLLLSSIFTQNPNKAYSFLFRNLGIYAQDTWRIRPRLTLTYGLRWDVDFGPQGLDGPNFAAVDNFNLQDLSGLTLAAAGAPPYQTTYGNFAPRLGIAYQLSQSQQWQTVVRGGFGMFYDLASSEAGNSIGPEYPFGSSTFVFGGTFPVPPGDALPPPVTPENLTGQGLLFSFDPHLKLPYTFQWNVAWEQGLGKQQVISASYIGSSGRRLLQTTQIIAPNPSFGTANLVTNAAGSNYNAMQLQFQRRLSHGIQATASYTWSHSIDDGSAGSIGVISNTLVPTLSPNQNRGPSDFDIRHAFTAGMTYELPTPRINSFVHSMLGGWSLQTVIQARSAPPVTAYDSNFFPGVAGFFSSVRPDIVAGMPLYLSGPPYPGGKAFNPAAFVDPPSDANGNPLRQGTLARNALRAFGASQWDFAIHREFPIRESLKLQFRAEMFNVLNHPIFAPPIGDLSQPSFGLSTQTLNQGFGGSTLSNGALNSLFEFGGPRSIQLALNLQF